MPHPFEGIVEGQLESVHGLQAQFLADPSLHKVNLMQGVYREKDEPFVLPSVIQAKQRLFEDPTWNHEYPPSHLGSKKFRDESAKLFFGQENPLITSDRVISMQTLGASGACHMGALFLKHHYGPWKVAGTPRKVYVPAESWVNHPNVFSFLGLEPKPLPYYNPSTRGIDFAALILAIASLPPQSVIVLQTAAQNPTGCDPTAAQWREFARTFKSLDHFAFLDAAYLGFVSGDAYTDAESVRIFADMGVPLLLAATYGKAFGLYSERVGFMMVIAPNGEVGKRIENHMKLLARAETGAQPAFGAKIVELILTDATLKRRWEADVQKIAGQLRERRVKLRGRLEALETPGTWHHISDQAGMFSFIGFSSEQIDLLREEHHVYIPKSGRVSISGLNDSNIEHVAQSISIVVKSTTREV